MPAKPSSSVKKRALRRPDPIAVGKGVTAYAVRPPTAEEGRWYWQALGKAAEGKRPTLWSGRGTVDEVTKALAGLVVDHGASPNAGEVRERREAEAGITVAVLLARWFNHVLSRPESFAPNTVRNYKITAETLTRDIGGYALREITPAQLERYFSVRVGAGARPGTAFIALRVLRTAWNWGIRNRHHSESWPKPDVKIRDRTKPRPDGGEVVAVLAALRRDAPQWCWRLATVIAATGMRVSEAWGVLCGDVRLERLGGGVVGGVLSIREARGIAKTGARDVYMAARLAAEVATWVAGQGSEARLVGPVTQATATMGAAKYLRPAARAVGAPWTGWHSFRRAAADGFAEAHVDPVVAAQQLGHTVGVMQTMYRAVRADQAQAAATALDATRTRQPPLRVVVGDE
jgi:integrase